MMVYCRGIRVHSSFFASRIKSSNRKSLIHEEIDFSASGYFNPSTSTHNIGSLSARLQEFLEIFYYFKEFEFLSFR